MPDYRRYCVPGGTYLFIINLLERRADLLVRHIEPLREAAKCTRADRPFHIDAWVVLPDHMHCVITTLPPGDEVHAIGVARVRWMFAAGERR